MPAPKLASFPKIRGALRFYQVASIITGVGLLLLCGEMVMKYGFRLELFAGGSGGALWWAEVVETADDEFASTGDGANLSLGILIAHGWFYVVYLFACFRIWSLMRWPFLRFLMLAAGGVVPLLSFIMEHFFVRDTRKYLAEREAASAQRSPSVPSEEIA